MLTLWRLHLFFPPPSYSLFCHSKDLSKKEMTNAAQLGNSTKYDCMAIHDFVFLSPPLPHPFPLFDFITVAHRTRTRPSVPFDPGSHLREGTAKVAC